MLSDRAWRLQPEAGAGLAHREGRGAAGLGDLVVRSAWVPLHLELDSRPGADLLALLGGSVLVEALETGLARHLAATEEAGELAALTPPGGGPAGGLDVRPDGHRPLAARAGPGVGRHGRRSRHRPSVRTAGARTGALKRNRLSRE